LQPKCEKYWPDRGAEKYGDIQVTLVKVEEFACHVAHTLKLNKVTHDHNNAVLIIALFFDPFKFKENIPTATNLWAIKNAAIPGRNKTALTKKNCNNEASCFNL
jgi:hypothetical protein